MNRENTEKRPVVLMNVQATGVSEKPRVERHVVILFET